MRQAGSGAVVVGWDLARGTRWVPPYEQTQLRVTIEGSATTPCRIDGAVPAPGTVVHLMLQGATRGLIGHGRVRSAPYLSADPDRPGHSAAYVLIEWDRLLPVEERILPEELSARVPDVPWQELYGPILELSGEDAHRLDRVWAAPHPSARAVRTVGRMEAQVAATAASAASSAASAAASAVSAVASSVRHAHLPTWHPHLPWHPHGRGQHPSH